MIGEDFLWVEKYRPKTVQECILPKRLKTVFQSHVDSGNIPNMTLAGGAGVGKTTVARAMCNELNSDYYLINGSNDRNIDTLRNEITQFASTVSMIGGRKYVILDEADYLNPNSTQPALRNFIEEYSKNCGFILTCNFKNKIIAPIVESRCPIVDVHVKKAEYPQLGAQFLERACTILESEGVEFEKKVVAELIMKFMPDWRRVLGELQNYSKTGKIDASILTNLSDENFNKLIESMKLKKFSEVRKWVAENPDDSTLIFRKFYDQARDRFDDASIPMLILIIAKYQYQVAHVNDPEINLTAFLVEVMADCNFK